MSDFEDQIDSNNVICPYCLETYQPEGEDYREDERKEECEECKRKYWVHQSFEVNHHTRPDCVINGRHHDYKLKMLGYQKSYFCTICKDWTLDLPEGSKG